MSAQDMFWAAPPIARTLTAAIVLVSIPGHLLGVPDLYWFIFDSFSVFTLQQLPQLWRIATCFLVTGPKLGMLLDPYFVFTYASNLETTAARFSQPGDFFVYLVFVSVIIVLLGGLYLGGIVLLSPLTLALAYTYAQENPTMQINYFIITFSAKWLPIVMLIGTMIMASPYAAIIQLTGLVAAHAYDFLTILWPQYGGGRKLLNTPVAVQRWFANVAGTPVRRGAGTAYNVRTPTAQNVPQQQTGSSGGWASGFGRGGAWGERGAGRRLGGE